MRTRLATRTHPNLKRGLSGLVILLSTVMATSPVAQADTPRPLVQVRMAPYNAIPGHYIVTLKPGVLASDVVTALSVRPAQVYQHVFDGFAAPLSPKQVSNLKANPEVESIEEDALAYAFDLPGAPTGPAKAGPLARPTTSWALDRIDQRQLPLNNTYNARHDGTGITAYIIDTGLDPNQSDFTGRLIPGFDAVGDGNGTIDCLGHGTMTAALVGGTTWGVAPKVKIAPVRVLGCDGSGAFSQIIAGFDWVAAHAIRPAVVNASLGGPKSLAANTAATALADLGVFVSVAAGNSSTDACTISPASATHVISIAASDSNDNIASFTNTGPCVNLIGPGVDITSAKLGGGNVTESGTSFASPLATGVGALFKQMYGDKYPTATVVQWIINAATPNVVSGVPSDTVNRMLYLGGL